MQAPSVTRRSFWPAWPRSFLLVLACATLAAGAILEVTIYHYAVTDVAYERLTKTRPKNRAEVIGRLPGFRETRVPVTSVSAPPLARGVSPGSTCFAYERYSGMTIEVVYGKSGEVQAIWPGYE